MGRVEESATALLQNAHKCIELPQIRVLIIPSPISNTPEGVCVVEDTSRRSRRKHIALSVSIVPLFAETLKMGLKSMWCISYINLMVGDVSCTITT